MKVIRSIKNRWILLKGSNRKIASQQGVFLSFVKSLMSVGLPLMKNVLTPLAKSVLVPLGSTAAAWAADAAIQKKTYGSGTATLVFSNEDLNNVIKILKSLEESSFLIKGVSETIENEVKKKNVDLMLY